MRLANFTCYLTFYHFDTLTQNPLPTVRSRLQGLSGLLEQKSQFSIIENQISFLFSFT
ncbi:hypothetical protein HMPREF1557_01050 [Streptococcus sobrinus W1703]|uniref:Uncharacterized protein n=1 Tax=Streptococcus sobrinus W1703 TaxID=1227275 RepID=U2IR06_9STRE|nr:hypothetical protein HMPREF1557_01050 [Streptococcus sobrinus W1703]